MKNIVIIFIMFCSQVTWGQNLIPNASFEDTINFGGGFTSPKLWTTPEDLIQKVSIIHLTINIYGKYHKIILAPKLHKVEVPTLGWPCIFCIKIGKL